MPPPWGITPLGFNRKPLAQILADAEDRARATMGAGLIVTPQSPMGQFIGIWSALADEIWIMAEAVYTHLDPDQAEGRNLDRVAKLRLLNRVLGETDALFRPVITHADRNDFDLADIEVEVRSVPGVTYARAYENATHETDENGIEPHSISVAVTGGEPTDIARAIRLKLAPGIGSSGNVMVETEVDGYCRSVFFTRVVDVPLTVSIQVRHSEVARGCQPFTVDVIQQALYEGLVAPDAAPENGEDITIHHLRTSIAGLRSVEIVGGAARIGEGEALTVLPYPIAFDERAQFAPDRILVVYI